MRESLSLAQRAQNLIDTGYTGIGVLPALLRDILAQEPIGWVMLHDLAILRNGGQIALRSMSIAPVHVHRAIPAVKVYLGLDTPPEKQDEELLKEFVKKYRGAQIAPVEISDDIVAAIERMLKGKNDV